MRSATVLSLLVALVAGVAMCHAVEHEYYWNEVSNATQWEEPAVPVPHEDTESGKKYYVDPKTGESTWEVCARAAKRPSGGGFDCAERRLAPCTHVALLYLSRPCSRGGSLLFWVFGD